ncbi:MULTISPECIES: cytochrome-c oxidase, cbb3-type subunit III [Gammaproteobacteria]|uniref:Cbb3-type cytochrome c oxidase subunit n=1 Tax=Vreelandella halophila TaxID=86177 RepID=A0A9X4YCY7_9GAMM|nr:MULTISPECIES: cytochrome-c oxidase, cbb3-type subunit III [Gammaproteobacteria]KAA8984380.1 cytochrome-c oxidase, cbb3-type subunit III [Halospina sp. K52047b]MYL26895.1 cytochrome-c oxidase, cbb3-type subunit III [Halomonas utahensis]MYL74156.1 cytochrome-c oxidase, cbb3-type subunit III [Halomonas sp. 22501_18_FS]
MSSFWSIWISALILIVVLGCWWLVWIVRRNQPSDRVENRSVGHEVDGIEELDNPLPKWWYWMFIGLILFSLLYLALYPGLGNYQGLLGWSQTEAWEREMEAAREKYGPLFAQYADTPAPELAHNGEAMQAAQRLFSNNCATCHGSAGRGGYGFPNLTDDNWIWGGSVDAIKHTLTNGRQANMPARGINPNLSNDQLGDITEYVLSLNDRSDVNEAAAERGKPLFAQACSTCHGQNAKGNQNMGAPNLTNDTWLYGGDRGTIMETLQYGRNGHMPAQKQLSEDQIHLMAAYVYRLSGQHREKGAE